MLDNKLPLVTIIIPTIGRPKYFLQSLKSALAQSYNNLEILVSDNYSNGITEEILSKTPNLYPSIRFVKRTHRMESSAHMNLCIKEAKGEFLMILSDDDLISVNYVREMVKAFSLNKNIKVALGEQKVINENEWPNSLFRDDNQITFYELNDAINIFKGSIRLNIYTYFSMFGRKSDFIKVGGFPEYPDGSNADNYLFFSLMFKGGVAVSSQLLFYRVYNNSSGLTTNFNKLVKSCEMYEFDILKMLSDINLNLKKRTLFFLKYKLRKNNLDMLRSRLKRIYCPKLGSFHIAGHYFSLLIYLFNDFNFFKKIKTFTIND